MRLFNLLNKIVSEIVKARDPLRYYPVGAVYISYNSTSPAELFGGTWAQISGYFPYFTTSTATGGSNTHTLTVAQMPSHSHVESGNNITYQSNTTARVPSGSKYTWDTSGGFSTSATGGGGSHNNMPAYQGLYAWRRTA